MTKKAKLIVKDESGKVLKIIKTKNLRKVLNSLDQGDRVKIEIQENNFAPLFVGDYIVKGLRNEPEEPDEPGEEPEEPEEPTPEPEPEPTPEPEPEPTPEPEPPKPIPEVPGEIFNSNKDWVGQAGQVVSGKFGNTGPNGKGFYTAASGSPKLRFITPTEYELEGSGSGIHPRIYGAVCNYNARIECTFWFKSESVDNITFKIRNRHGMGGDCENRVGGIGCDIDREKGGMKIEKCHNEHESGSSWNLPKKLVTGQKYRMAFTVKDANNGIEQILELDYFDGKGFQKIGSRTYTGSYAPYFDKALFLKHSEFWIRYNGGSGKVGFQDVRVIALPD